MMFASARGQLGRVMLLVGLLLAATRSVAAPPEGVQFVRATSNSIHLTGLAANAGVQIVELQPWQAVLRSNFTAAVAGTTNAARFDLRVARFDGARDRLFSSFLAVSQALDGTLRPLGTNRFVEEFLGVSLYQLPFPDAASKKGLQVQMVDDALALGVKHAAFNVNFSQMIDLSAAPDSLPWLIDGQAVRFRRSYVERLDHQVRPLSDAGAVITLILLACESQNPALNRILLHPGYSKSAPNRLGAFNTSTAEGVLHFRACIEFLADHYARPGPTHARVANFILGNEVNSHWFWANRGRVSMEGFAEDYLRAARIASTSLRRISSSARLYLSLEHHWNIRYPGGDEQQAFAGRAFLDYFNRRAKEQGDFEWHVAFHPYPEDLFEPRTWNDKSATTNVLTTPRITFKNIELLPGYLRRPEMLYRGQPRRVILSEQGFHTVDGPDGEIWQAAAYAYAWRKIARMDGIDAFILHRHVDHPQEGGLKLGLWRRDEGDRNSTTPAAKKKIYELFRSADTADWQRAFEFALPVIGIERWEELDRFAGH
jgi:hypothetical protein